MKAFKKAFKQSLALFAVLVMAAGAAPASAQDKIKLRVLGMPLATGNIQKHREQPYFETLAQRTGLPFEVEYKPLDATGIKEFEQLRIMRSGLFDVGGLRLGQISRDEPMILGLDLVGLNSEYETAKKVVAAYQDVVGQQLEKKFNTKLLGVWPFGPQLIFCKPPIKSLADMKGLKVRILDGVMAKFMEKVGATPVTMAFAEVAQGLSLGTVDCAVTGPSSANSAGWPESVTHVYPLALQVAVQGYGINLNAWNRLKPEQREGLQKAIAALTEDIWAYSKELWDDAMRCNGGQDSCTTGRKYKLTTVEVKPQDRELAKAAVREISFPAWKEQCDAVTPGCSEAWKKAVGPIIGMH
ncbi:MAG: TRAP transporter substrate-binding protein [Hyphomonadaceae bacterium]|jgi:TRAP-type C4-dicarboxylate transport system substrate-binding protein|nr:TRAP transporter substrate-binding protein [Hyphomonadaceae bacterium]